MKRTKRFLLILPALTLLAGAAAAEDEVPEAATDEPGPAVQTSESAAVPRASADQLLLDSTSVRGNQELPRVMYIVPWKESRLSDVVGKPVNSLIDEVLSPIDRDVFQRQTNYFDQLYGPAESDAGD